MLTPNHDQHSLRREPLAAPFCNPLLALKMGNDQLDTLNHFITLTGSVRVIFYITVAAVRQKLEGIRCEIFVSSSIPYHEEEARCLI